MFEGWTMVLEVLDGMKRVGNGMVFKIGFEKVYDVQIWTSCGLSWIRWGLGRGG